MIFLSIIIQIEKKGRDYTFLRRKRKRVVNKMKRNNKFISLMCKKEVWIKREAKDATPLRRINLILVEANLISVTSFDIIILKNFRRNKMLSSNYLNNKGKFKYIQNLQLK